MLGLLSGLTQALGMLGAAAGEAPYHTIGRIGWMALYYVHHSDLFIVLARFTYKYIQDTPHIEDSQKIVPAKKKLKFYTVCVSFSLIKQTWINAFYAGFLFGPTAVIGEALGPAYLQFGRGLTPHACFYHWADFYRVGNRWAFIWLVFRIASD